MSNRTAPVKAYLDQIRWYAELGANGFDTLSPDIAAENAQYELEAIVRFLDHLEDTPRLVSILGVKGIGIKAGSRILPPL